MISEAWKNKKLQKQPIVDAIVKINEAVFNRMVKLFDIAYHLAKHEQPFSYFAALVSLEKRHGVDLGDTYNNPVQTKVFTQFIADDIRREYFTNQMISARYVSLLTDGSTDRGQTEKECMYIKFLEDGMPKMKYFG